MSERLIELHLEAERCRRLAKDVARSCDRQVLLRIAEEFDRQYAMPVQRPEPAPTSA